MIVKECTLFKDMMTQIQNELGLDVVDPNTRQKVGASDDIDVIYEQIETFDIGWIKPANMRDPAQKIVDIFWPRLLQLQDEKKRELERMKHGDELPSGVLEMVKVYMHQAHAVGRRQDGRSSRDKGVIAKIMPEEDMPFLKRNTGGYLPESWASPAV